MKQRFYFLIPLMLELILFQVSGFSEGSKEIYIGTNNTWLFMCTDNIGHCNNGGDRTPFATYGCTDPDRLYFSTLTSDETVFLGFNGTIGAPGNVGNHVVFDIRDFLGNVVYSEINLPTAGTGFITNISAARVGPTQIYGAGGYTAIDFHPATPGTFYIEFAMRDNGTNAFYPGSLNMNLIDVTVQDTVAAVVKPGRLYSKSWQFYETGRYSGTTYIYSVDSIITSCACNTMQGGIWVQFCNQWGCQNTGNFTIDRKSTNTQSLLPEYKIFLNNPDITLYPPATTLGQIVPPQPSGVQDCNTGHITYTVNVDKPGSVEIDLSFPVPYVTRVLNQAVVTGSNTIIWDGLDGTTPVGVPVPNGVQVTFTVKYINGLTNLPFFDVEGNPNGFIISLVNPPGSEPLVYWDDSNVGGGSNFTGCLSPPPPGCHSWSGAGLGFGNLKTLNTWWYNVSSTTSPVQITQFRHAGTLTFVQPPTAVCAGSTGNLFSVNQDINTEVFHWSYTGTGATIHQVNPSDYFVTVDFAVNATSGSLQVYGTNSNCLAPGPTASLSIIINPVPVVNPPSPNTICTGVMTNINLTSVPASTNFSWISPPPTCSANIVACPPGQSNSNLISDLLTLTNNIPGTVTYHIISTLNSCSSTPQDFTLNVLPSPTPVVTGSTNVCAGSSGIVYTTDPGMTAYTWSISAGGTITSGLGTNSIQVTWNTPGVQSVTVGYTDVNSCVTIVPTVYPVTVNTLPTATINGTHAVCQNAPSPSITFTGNSAATPYTFTYNINGGGNQVVTTTVGNSVTVAVPTNVVGSFTYNLVSVQDGSTPPCSQPQAGSATVDVNPLPTATILGTTQVCQNAAAPMITFTGSSTTAPYTFTYNINGGGNQVVTTVVGNSVTVPAPTNVVGPFTYNLISVQDGSPTNCSQPQAGSAMVTVNPLPTATISGNTAVCQNAPSPMVTFTGASSTAPYTFTYNINGGANLFVTTVAGNSVNVAVPTTPPGTYVYNLLSVKDAGPSTCSQNQPGSASVIVNPLPIPTISGPLSVCANTIATYTTEPSMTNYTWTISGGGVITLGSTTNTITVQWGPANGSYTIQVNYINADGCTAAAPTPVNITVNTLPTPTIAGSNNVCSGLPTQIYSTQVGMSNYSWNVSAGGSIASGGAATDNTVTVLWNTAGAQTVSVNYVVGTGCTAPAPVPYPVTVKPRPSITNAANSTQCSGVNTSITPIPDLGGTTFSWTATGSSGNVTGFNPGAGVVISDNLVNSGPNVEFVDYVVTPSLNGCDGLTATFRVFVNPVADVYFNPNGQTFCSGGTSNISILSHTAAATFTWTAVGSSGNISGFGPGVTSPISQTLTSIGTGPEFVTYNVSPSFGGCLGFPGSVIVHVNPNPVVSYTACTDIITTTAAQPIKLRGGIPLGGTYSGASVIASTFYPPIAGVGNHTLTYSYLNTWGCTANATQVISVVNPAAFVCDNQLMDIRDNFSYATVKLGAQCWMAANLNYGTIIASTQMQRDNCTPEKYCYNDIPGNCLSSGGFYQWDEIMQYDNTAAVQGLCPPGWHVPSEGDWQTLFNFYTSNGFAGSPLKSSGFSGFNAMLDGTRFDNVNYYLPNFATFLWSSTSEGISKAWAHAMNNPDPSVSTYPGNRSNAFNVRCIKD